MRSKVGISPQSLPYGFQNEIMDHPCLDGGLETIRSNVPNLMNDVSNLMKDVLNLMKNVPNFVKDVPRVPKCVPRWGSATNNFIMGF